MAGDPEKQLGDSVRFDDKQELAAKVVQLLCWDAVEEVGIGMFIQGDDGTLTEVEITGVEVKGWEVDFGENSPVRVEEVRQITAQERLHPVYAPNVATWMEWCRRRATTPGAEPLPASAMMEVGPEDGLVSSIRLLSPYAPGVLLRPEDCGDGDRDPILRRTLEIERVLVREKAASTGRGDDSDGL
jgi:hypothetical protein